MVGIKDVAHAAGVSTATVSYVFSGKRTISYETRRKVIDAMNKLEYVPDASAQKLRGGKNKIIALSTPIRDDVNQAKYNAYFMQTTWQATREGYYILVLAGKDGLSDILQTTRSNLVDAVMLLDVRRNDKRAMAAGSYGKPCVAIGVPTSHDECACVDIDFTEMGKNAAQYLFDEGHRTVAFLRTRQSDYERQSGYTLLFRESFFSAAKNLGMEIVESEKIDYAHFNPSRFIDHKILGDEHPTAFVNQADAVVLRAVLGELRNRGINIPDDLSVLSCGTYLEGELITQQVDEMPLMPGPLCAEAIGLLLDSISGAKRIGGVVDLMKPELVKRGSVAPPKGV